MAEWQPAQYLKYEQERTRPSRDLVQRIGSTPARILDLGCGPGNSTRVLRDRWPGAAIVGLDRSPAMLQSARAALPGVEWVEGDAAGDLSGLGQFDLVFSNAVLQWLPAHEMLLPRLFARLRPGGVLAVQVPYVRHLPLFSCILELAASAAFAPYFPQLPPFPTHFPYPHFYNILCRLTDKIDGWQTDYQHVMAAHEDIVEWCRGSALLPFLQRLPADRAEEFLAAYAAAVAPNYPPAADGRILMPFTRIFFIAEKK